ncbi:MAG: hypothetical protein U0T69_13725 [Chitinophagales bacterium]|nr:hypothetical protein [Chitinophagales bacterium]
MFKKIYLIIGILTVLIFIATGQYLLRAFPDKEKLDLTFRVMQRSRHIFILLSGCTLSVIGVYFQKSNNKFSYALQLLATFILFTANILFIYCFFYEVDISFIPSTPLLHVATYSFLAGIVLHAIASWIKQPIS